MENTIYVSNKIQPDIPILIVDLDDENVDSEYRQQARKIISNIKRLQEETGVKVYNTCGSEPIEEMRSLEYIKCISWSDNRDKWREHAKEFLPYKKIQICGMFRELCMVAVADYLIDSGIEPVIIAHNGYSISAEASVADGDTLENRAIEVNRKLKYCK